MPTRSSCKKITHTSDLCVIGGGLAGMLAAISAARHGSKVTLIHDRPVLGGNCSSEIRMWALGCHGDNNRETGILEEILLENMYRNPDRNFSIWDSILYEKVKAEKNINLLMNCSCNELEMDGSHISSVKAWQLTTYTWHTVTAKIFIDCSGDSILAPLCGAEFRVGREAASEYGEDIAPETADNKTMGLTCLMQAVEKDRPAPFIAPEWARKFDSDDDLPFRDHSLSYLSQNFWWMELGGENDSIHDTEALKDELLKIAFGVWDHIKNRGDHGAENWALDWVGFLPGKRESRRYIGDHILTQNDVRSKGQFPDLVAYGGWSMDDHNPAGFRYPDYPTIFHKAPAPYGIPYRCLYSKNIGNLMFAGRNISATHAAMSSSRVMATCAIIGQAVGTAASIAVKNNLFPRGVYEKELELLRNTLMDDDCFLPFSTRPITQLSLDAMLSSPEGNPSVLLNGVDRPLGDDDNGWSVALGSYIQYSFPEPRNISGFRIIFDSDLNRTSCDGDPELKTKPMICNRPLGLEPFGFPKTMVKSYRVECLDSSGVWQTAFSDDINRYRLVKRNINTLTTAIRLVPEQTFGAEKCHVFAFEIF